MSFDWVIPLLTLSAMEIVLGIDNVIFIAILVGRLPPAQQAFGRRAGLGLALVARLLLLLAISWIAGLTQPLFSLADLGIPENWLQHTVSWRDVILLAGGLFLIAKSTFEIHHKLEGEETHAKVAGSGARFGMVLFQVALLDIVFSLDSVITAVGMVMGEAKEPAWDKLWIMVAAIVISMVVMLFFAGVISRFVHRHPTLKILALSFLILIGVMLVAEGVGQHIPRGYMYFAMVFAVVVEMLNLRMRAKTAPVRLHEPAPPAEMA